MTKDFIPGKPAVTPAATSASGRKGEASETQLSPHSGVETDVSSVAIDGSVLAMTTWPGVRQESLSPEGLTDAQVMVRVREGDEAAFDYLIQKYRRPIIGFMYRMVHNAGAAEDLAQEVFLRVYRSRASYEPSAKF
ncbi:MAG TPA: sigma factor, partial [Terriglobales bacterium]|nr:sigma factor [Terriglobales bacterium]